MTFVLNTLIVKLEFHHIAPITALEQGVNAYAKSGIVIILTVSLDCGIVIIQLVQKEFMRVIGITAHIKLTASGFFLQRITSLGLKDITHFISFSRQCFEINNDGAHNFILLISSPVVELKVGTLGMGRLARYHGATCQHQLL